MKLTVSAFLLYYQHSTTITLFFKAFPHLLNIKYNSKVTQADSFIFQHWLSHKQIIKKVFFFFGTIVLSCKGSKSAALLYNLCCSYLFACLCAWLFVVFHYYYICCQFLLQFFICYFYFILYYHWWCSCSCCCCCTTTNARAIFSTTLNSDCNENITTRNKTFQNCNGSEQAMRGREN